MLISAHGVLEIGNRRQLEGLLGRYSAAQRADSDIANLKNVFTKIQTAVTAKEFESLVRLKADFYHILMRIANNQTLTEILTNLQARVAQFRAFWPMRQKYIQSNIDEIKVIIAHIEQQNIEGAEAACIAHVTNAGNLLIELLEEAEQKE